MSTFFSMIVDGWHSHVLFVCLFVCFLLLVTGGTVVYRKKVTNQFLVIKLLNALHCSRDHLKYFLSHICVHSPMFYLNLKMSML